MFRIVTVPCLVMVTAVMVFVACTDAEPPTTPEPATPLLTAADFAAWTVAPIEPVGTGRINTAFLDGCPFESPDALQFFIASNRPDGAGLIDIWVASRPNTKAEWGAPANLGEPVNTQHDDFCPTGLTGGDLLFVSRLPNAGVCDRHEGSTDSDIYSTRQHPVTGWQAPEHLGCAVNSSGDEFSPSYAAAGGGMLFFSSDRDSPGQHKIYVSHRLPGGGWGTPSEVAELNAGGNAFRPSASQDGRVIVFDSGRPGGQGAQDIWMATRPNLNAPWSEPFNLGPTINSASAESRGSLSRDGKRVYFGSNRPGGMGSTDVYVATRP